MENKYRQMRNVPNSSNWARCVRRKDDIKMVQNNPEA